MLLSENNPRTEPNHRIHMDATLLVRLEDLYNDNQSPQNRSGANSRNIQLTLFDKILVYHDDLGLDFEQNSRDPYIATLQTA